MAKLSPDYVKWVATLDATQVQREFHKLEKANRELQASTNASRKAMVELEAQGKKGSTEWKNHRKSITENSKDMAILSAKMAEVSKRFDLSTMTVKQLKKHLKALQHEFNDTSKAINPKRYKELQVEIEKTRQAIYSATGQTEKLKNGFLSLSRIRETVSGFFLAVGSVILSFFTNSLKDAFKTIVDFEKANSTLAGVLGSTKAGIRDLTEEARRLGATTSFTAAQVTSLQIELAKLGFAKDQIKDMEAGVLKFAQAVGTDLGSAAAFAGASMRIFDIEAKDVEDMLASLAIGTTKSALDFTYLQSAMSTIGPVANSFGFSIQDTIALLGNLANAGFDASSAATATRNILLNLADSNGKLAQALGSPVKNLDDLVAGLNKLTAEGIDLNKALDLTDKRSVSAFSKFLQAADSVTRLRDSVTGCKSEFNAMYDEMSDNVATALDILSSTVEGVILRFYESRGPLKSFVEGLTALVEWIGKGIDLIQKFGGVITTSVKAWAAYKLAIIATNAAAKLKLATLYLLTAEFGRNRIAIMAMSLASGKATKAIKLLWMTMRLNPIGLVISALTLLVGWLINYNDKAKEAAEKSKELANKMRDYRRQISDLSAGEAKYSEDELLRLKKLYDAATNQHKAMNKRLDAVKTLQAQYPEYFKNLSSETILAGNARTQYQKLADSIREVARARAAKDKIEENEKERLGLEVSSESAEDRRSDLEQQYDRLIKKEADLRQAAKGGNKTILMRLKAVKAQSAAIMNQLSDLDNEIAESQDKMAALSYTNDRLMKKFGDAIENLDDTATESANIINTTADKTIDRLKEINDELKKLRKEDPKSKEELDQIQKRIKALQEEKKQILGNAKAKHEAGTYRDDSINRVTNPVDSAHMERLLAINLRNDLSEQDKVIEKNKEMIIYCAELNEALEKLRSETDATHTQTLDKITAEQDKAKAQMVSAQQAIDEAMLAKVMQGHAERVKALEAFHKIDQEVFKIEVAEKKISQEQMDIQMLAQTQAHNQDMIRENEKYYKLIEGIEAISGEKRKALLEKINEETAALRRKDLIDAANFAEKMRQMSTNESSFRSMKEAYERRRDVVRDSYDAMIAIAQKEGLETEALEKEKLRRLSAIDFEERQKAYEQKKEFESSTWQEDYDLEMAKLDDMLKNEVITVEQYEKQKLKIRMKYAQQYASFFTGTMTSMFSAIQDAEIARSDAKYDVLIQQAKNNGEDTAALEEEKENKKLEIQKKYADVNFAIKCSQIIADTAVAIMKAHAELGPLAGAVAAAMLAATGAAQLVSAKAERDKIKNMKPGNTSGSASSATAERVLTGYSDGGYTGDGDRYEVAGIVHRGEYVVPKPIMDNPRVVDAVGAIEAIRRNKILASGMAAAPSTGFADGGFTSAAAAPAVDTADLTEAVRELRNALGNIRAHVVYKDIERAGESLDRARAPFTRKK